MYCSSASYANSKTGDDLKTMTEMHADQSNHKRMCNAYAVKSIKRRFVSKTTVHRYIKIDFNFTQMRCQLSMIHSEARE